MSEILEQAQVRAGIVDCDIHPTMRSKKELDPWLPERWRRHLAEYGHQVRIPFTSGTQYPKSAPATARRDAWPPSGGPPGSDLDFMREQLLDPNDIAYGGTGAIVGRRAQHRSRRRVLQRGERMAGGELG